MKKWTKYQDNFALKSMMDKECEHGDTTMKTKKKKDVKYFFF